MKNIVILGSTGSIGTQTLEVVRNNKDINVVALAAGSNVELLLQQVMEFKPKLVCLYDKEKAKELEIRTSHLSVKVVWGMEGLIDCAKVESAEVVVAAMVGMIGIQPVMEAIKERKHIALANKETLVCAGHLIMPLAKEYGVHILPVDSEHSAIFQVLHGEKKEQINKVILTASGGPFRGYKRSQLEKIKVEDALKHPNWEMGKKITIDSSTMVNKGLEVIEAKWLFDVDFGKIQVIIQPQSVIHSMVEFLDGGVLAQLGTPDMKLPIQYALYYPERRHLPGERLDFGKLRDLTFEEPDMETFQGLSLAFQAGGIGGSMPTVYNAANELAVSKFLNRQISYLEIPEIISFAMSQHELRENPSFKEILEVEKETYQCIEEKWS